MNQRTGITHVGPGFFLDPEHIALYANAISDDNPAYRGTSPVAPPTYLFVAGFDALRGCLAESVPPAAVSSGAFHVRQVIRISRLAKAGDTLTSTARITEAVESSFGSLVTTHVTTEDERGEFTSDSFVTVLFRSAVDLKMRAAEETPRLGLRPRGAPRTIADFVSVEQTDCYAAASGDDNPIHLSDDAARSAGLRGRVAHGMSVLAMAVKGAVNTYCDGDPARVREIGCRFSRPIPVNSEVKITYWESTPERIAFRCDGPNGTALKDAALILASEPSTS